MLIGIWQVGCQTLPSANSNYKYATLDDLANQKSKIYRLPYNVIQDEIQRYSIFKAFKGESINEDKAYLIQPIAGYPNRYLIADTSRYFIELIDIEADSITILNNLHGKYLGVLADTNAASHAINGKIIVLEPHHCDKKNQGRNYSNIIVLYEINATMVFPIEILDFECYDSPSLSDAVAGCFCGMNRIDFKKQLVKDILLAKQDPFPAKMKRAIHH
jgi:hypothetical protein